MDTSVVIIGNSEWDRARYRGKEKSILSWVDQSS